MSLPVPPSSASLADLASGVIDSAADANDSANSEIGGFGELNKALKST